MWILCYSIHVTKTAKVLYLLYIMVLSQFSGGHPVTTVPPIAREARGTCGVFAGFRESTRNIITRSSGTFFGSRTSFRRGDAATRLDDPYRVSGIHWKSWLEMDELLDLHGKS